MKTDLSSFFISLRNSTQTQTWYIVSKLHIQQFHLESTLTYLMNTPHRINIKCKMWEYHTWKTTSIRRYYLCQIKKKKFKTCFSLLTFQSLIKLFNVTKSGQKYHGMVQFSLLLQLIYEKKQRRQQKTQKKTKILLLSPHIVLK